MTKKLIQMEERIAGSNRAWPKNYTYQQYVQRLDNARERQAIYNKRLSQARAANDKSATKTMKANVDRYETKIARLENDKEFYKIYKLRERKALVIKDKEKKAHIKAQKQIKIQNQNTDKLASQRQKEMDKKREQLLKDKEKRLDEKKERLELNIEKCKKENKSIKSSITEKEKELAELKQIAQESGDANDPSFIEGINLIESELNNLKNNEKINSQKLEKLSLELETFNKDSDTPKEKPKESQMILSTDPLPQESEK